MITVLVLLFLSGAGLVVGSALHVLLRCGVDVHSHLVDALAFLLLATLLHHFLLALLAFLLFCLFLRTCALIERVEVDTSEHIHLRSIQDFLLTLGRKDGGSGLGALFSVLFFSILLLLRLSLHHFRLCLHDILFRFCFFNHVVGIIFFTFFNGCIDGSRFCFCCRSINGFCYFRFFFFNGFHLTDGNSLGFLSLFRIRRRTVLRGSRSVDAVEIYLAQWLVLLLFSSSEKFFRTLFLRFLRTLLLLRLLQQKFFGLRSYFLVLLELMHKSLILLVVELKARFRLNFAQFTSLFEELHCRLESDIQFT